MKHCKGILAGLSLVMAMPTMAYGAAGKSVLGNQRNRPDIAKCLQYWGKYLFSASGIGISHVKGNAL